MCGEEDRRFGNRDGGSEETPGFCEPNLHRRNDRLVTTVHVNVYRSDGEAPFVACIGELRGCIARGATSEQAVTLVLERLDEYRTLMRSQGFTDAVAESLDPRDFVVRVVPRQEHPEDEGHGPRDNEAVRAQLEASARLVDARVGMFSSDMDKHANLEAWSARDTLEHLLAVEAVYVSRMSPADLKSILEWKHELRRMVIARVAEATRSANQVGATHAWPVLRVVRRILEHEYEHLANAPFKRPERDT
jgi:predicted RNase H-like HicB family nuclease